MSQPEIFGDNANDPFAIPLASIDQCVELFHQSARPKQDSMIGIEYEMFGQIDATNRPLPYEGPVSITNLFNVLIEQSKHGADPFSAIKEGDHIVGLSCNRAVIALEPGGQLEIAARPKRELLDATKVFDELVKEIETTAKTLGINCFALGIHPSARREDMAVVKKARYGIMRNHMESKQGLGLDMMTRSCAIQINLDYQDEKDLVTKSRLGLALVPIYSLLCSSAAFIDGKPTQLAVARGNVWRKTDPARTGIPAVFFSPQFGYEAWINLVLDVPMYFIRRGQTYHDAQGASFRDFMAHGLRGHRAYVRDFIDHMSTVFTEVRLKPIIELRSADALPVPFVNALTALSWALFYDDNAQARAGKIFADATHKEIVDLHNNVIDHGRKAEYRGEPIYGVAEQLIGIAEEALREPKKKALLSPLANLVRRDITCAEWILAHFQPLNESNLRGLVKSFAPFNNPLA